ncbi:MAG TPA: 4-diphosphocytidyl-2C-methyl-D-erythritol kinase, partial [Acidimicrobiaceae bacterium]|nr:4-diphosphocytidyl-2C-methyl-D-erythritol kinase [Acidimicrobiaceae bacterium]
MRTVAVLLAAGGGSRYRGPTHKLLAVLHGLPVWQHALQHVLGAGFDAVVVVTGAAPLPLPPNVVEAHNPLWATGQDSSLRT